MPALATARCSASKLSHVIRPDNADITSAELRSFLRKAGVSLLCQQDAVIYANQSYLFVHAVSNGICELNVPGCRDLVDALSGQPYPAQFACKKGESYLFCMIP